VVECGAKSGVVTCSEALVSACLRLLWAEAARAISDRQARDRGGGDGGGGGGGMDEDEELVEEFQQWEDDRLSSVVTATGLSHPFFFSNLFFSCVAPFLVTPPHPRLPFLPPPLVQQTGCFVLALA